MNTNAVLEHLLPNNVHSNHPSIMKVMNDV